MMGMNGGSSDPVNTVYDLLLPQRCLDLQRSAVTGSLCSLHKIVFSDS